MIQAYLYDSDYIFTESKFVEILGNYKTDVPMSIGYVKPKFDIKKNEWVEGASEQEIKDWEDAQVKPQPTEIEILQAKLNSATEQLDFQEELIVEMAMMIY